MNVDANHSVVSLRRQINPSRCMTAPSTAMDEKQADIAGDRIRPENIQRPAALDWIVEINRLV